MYRFDPFVQKPATSPLGLFTLEGAAAGDSLPEWVALRTDYAHGLLALSDSEGHNLGNVLPNRLDMHLLASIGIRKLFELGLDLPVVAYNQDGFDVVRSLFGNNHALAQQLFPPVQGTGLGDMRFVPKLALPFHKPFSLALIPELRLRTGFDKSFMGDSLGPLFGHAGPVFAPRAEVEGTIWRFRVLGELGYVIRGQEQYFNLKVGDQLTFGTGAELALPPVPHLDNWEAIAEFNGTTQVAAPFTFRNSTAYKTPLELVGGARVRFAHGLLAFAGFGSGLSGGGYGRELFRAFAGVGWEPPGTVSTVPVSAAEEDRDHDGIPDVLDRCPDEPGAREDDGCPDRDGDGVPDIDDRCPDQAGPAENWGCPVEGPKVIYAPPKLELRVGITFETGAATIKSESFPVLDEVAGFLRQHEEIKKILIEGHTDNVGSARINLDLSERRARSVVQYLVKKGIAARRMTSRGFGFGRPIASNVTALGRAKNRRVEFTVIDPPAPKARSGELAAPAPKAAH